MRIMRDLLDSRRFAEMWMFSVSTIRVYPDRGRGAEGAEECDGCYDGGVCGSLSGAFRAEARDGV